VARYKYGPLHEIRDAWSLNLFFAAPATFSDPVNFKNSNRPGFLILAGSAHFKNYGSVKGPASAQRFISCFHCGVP